MGVTFERLSGVIVRGTLCSMRLVVLAFAPLALAACSSSGPPDQPDPVDASTNDAIAPTDSSTDAGTDAADATVDAPADAPGDACSMPDDGEGSTRCAVLGTCSACAQGTLYRCEGTRKRPMRGLGAKKFEPIEKAFAVASSGSTTDYCAPAACVRAEAEDATCISARPLAIRCPAKANGDAATAIPSFCSYVGSLVPGATSIRMCCDDIDPT